MLNKKQQSFNSTFKPRTSTLAGGGRLKPVSPKAVATRKQVSVACPLGSHCLACGTSQQLTRSHILTQKQYPRQAANPLNVVTLCWPCHQIWENEKARFGKLYPEACKEKLRRMKQLDKQSLFLLCQKHPTLGPLSLV